MNPAELHREAMRLADLAALARLRGDDAQASALFRRAWERETAAAECLRDKRELEPSRSVLHRSAASLALECGEIGEAVRLIAAGLSNDPPDEIGEELRYLLVAARSRELAT